MYTTSYFLCRFFLLTFILSTVNDFHSLVTGSVVDLEALVLASTLQSLTRLNISASFIFLTAHISFNGSDVFHETAD